MNSNQILPAITGAFYGVIFAYKGALVTATAILTWLLIVQAALIYKTWRTL